MSGATAASRGRVRAREFYGDGVPEHLKCSVCLDAPCGRIEQCTNGEHNIAHPLRTRPSRRQPPRMTVFSPPTSDDTLLAPTPLRMTHFSPLKPPLTPNLYLYHAGHLMCAEAGAEGGDACSVQVRGVRAGAKCPVCRQALARTPIRALAVEHTIAALPAACRHCAGLSTRGAVLGHEARCPRAPARCAAAADGCRWGGLLYERDAHEATCVRGRATAITPPSESNQLRARTTYLLPELLC